MPTDVQKVVAYCEAKLDLNNLNVPDGYPHLPLCIIDAVFSIGIRYSVTRKVVERFELYLKEQGVALSTFSISDFCDLYDELSLEYMTERVYQNRNRTSARNGILKSEAVWRIAQVLRDFGVEYLKDMPKVIGNQEFETAYRQIKGQTDVSLKYLYILCRVTEYIKPDRHIIGFVNNAVSYSVKKKQAETLLLNACEQMQEKYPHLNPRSLDHTIWQFQRQQ